MLHKCLSEVLGHHFLLEQVSVLFCVLCLTHWSKFCHMSLSTMTATVIFIFFNTIESVCFPIKESTHIRIW